MNEKQDTYQVAIVGGGPVGLFLASCLHQSGISCIVLEKRSKPVTHSRSIGIHPVSLELFEEMGLADAFTSKGIKVKQGRAYCNSHPIGTLSFASCPPPFRYILTLPQYQTESLLDKQLHVLDATILKRNAMVIEVEERKNLVSLAVNHGGDIHKIDAKYIVGCDGKHSFTRGAASIAFHETTYDDTYIMGDFTDNTALGNAAAIYMCNQGLIESFPLSKIERRWVIKTDRYLEEVSRNNIESRVLNRINHDLSATENTMLSSFGVQKSFAETMARNRILLAGDAAHVVSPIGGQGMNLGWMDARDLANCLAKIFNGNERAPSVLARYSKRRLRIARKAARRAEFNMAMGQKSESLFLRKWLIKSLINTPLSHLMAHIFTMRGLETPFYI